MSASSSHTARIVQGDDIRKHIQQGETQQFAHMPDSRRIACWVMKANPSQPVWIESRRGGRAPLMPALTPMRQLAERYSINLSSGVASLKITQSPAPAVSARASKDVAKREGTAIRANDNGGDGPSGARIITSTRRRDKRSRFNLAALIHHLPILEAQSNTSRPPPKSPPMTTLYKLPVRKAPVRAPKAAEQHACQSRKPRRPGWVWPPVSNYARKERTRPEI